MAEKLPTDEQKAANHAISAVAALFGLLGGPVGGAFGAGLVIGANLTMAAKYMSEEDTGDDDGGTTGGEPPDGGVSGGVDIVLSTPVTVTQVGFGPIDRTIDPTIPAQVFDRFDLMLNAMADAISVGRAFDEALIRHKWATFTKNDDAAQNQRQIASKLFLRFSETFVATGIEIQKFRDAWVQNDLPNPSIKPNQVIQFVKGINQSGFPQSMAELLDKVKATDREKKTILFILNSVGGSLLPSTLVNGFEVLSAAFLKIAATFDVQVGFKPNLA